MLDSFCQQQQRLRLTIYFADEKLMLMLLPSNQTFNQSHLIKSLRKLTGHLLNMQSNQFLIKIKTVNPYSSLPLLLPLPRNGPEPNEI